MEAIGRGKWNRVVCEDVPFEDKKCFCVCDRILQKQRNRESKTADGFSSDSSVYSVKYGPKNISSLPSINIAL